MTSRAPSQCLYCARWSGYGTTCEAYPQGIPGEIWANVADHRQPQPGDGGLQWKADLGVDFPDWAMTQLPGTEARALLAAFERVAGKDTHPGGEQLHLWWTKGAGLKEWVDNPHPYTTLYHKLLEHMDGNEMLAHKTAGAWYFEVFGHGPTAGIHHDNHA